jgi:hypothetical protein
MTTPITIESLRKAVEDWQVCEAQAQEQLYVAAGSMVRERITQAIAMERYTSGDSARVNVEEVLYQSSTAALHTGSLRRLVMEVVQELRAAGLVVIRSTDYRDEFILTIEGINTLSL